MSVSNWEIAPTLADPIASVVTEWVHQECVESVKDRNAYLDDLDVLQASLALPLDDPTNLGGAKHFSHANRQRFWGEGLVLEPRDDFTAARQTFNVLMQVSGCAKRMLWLGCRNQEEYDVKKVSPNVIGIDAAPILKNYLGLDKLTMKVSGAEDLNKRTLYEFERKTTTLMYIQSRATLDVRKPFSPSMNALKLNQGRWVRLAAHSIMSAAAYRNGDLAAVPLLEPKSISDDPAIIYPFEK